MRPAFSVIFFTTASGAGYGLLALLGLAALLGGVPADRGLGVAGLGLALALITAGLLSSTFHLGHPERAWRAFSQWRSSWLSREGVAAVATYLPALAFAAVWVLGGTLSGALGLLSALGAAATVYCTGQIYASLKPIARWHHPLTVPVYLAMALATGGLLALLLLFAFGLPGGWLTLLTLLALPAAWLLKLRWWQETDGAAATSTAGTATGLGRFGDVRLLERPHSGSNYLLDEMVFKVARKHAGRLRRIAVGLGLLLPWLLILGGWLAAPSAGAALLALLAVVSAGAGVVVERWLFFAEAQHTVSLYYGASSTGCAAPQNFELPTRQA
ncbi:DmsC/YnfH family molybdoenzyme membrane anchor subunit [Geminicoccaceae bacterium 1502E]|nr:DmsC/YnfH family molybdoenzyme membrane anchor subunit [Geminicoccaceae bacterium 1502E]